MKFEFKKSIFLILLSILITNNIFSAAKIVAKNETTNETEECDAITLSEVQKNLHNVLRERIEEGDLVSIARIIDTEINVPLKKGSEVIKIDINDKDEKFLYNMINQMPLPNDEILLNPTNLGNWLKSRYRVIKRMLDLGADLNILTPTGETILDFCKNDKRRTATKEMIKSEPARRQKAIELRQAIEKSTKEELSVFPAELGLVPLIFSYLPTPLLEYTDIAKIKYEEKNKKAKEVQAKFEQTAQAWRAFCALFNA